ncbi:uncharacterized protein Z518_02396 [Rhinocladiella mackenziei CBS 650.93]|uniref:Rhinocladiella mackenziei CBS 650.93 unplaced genomic scaffold supercont1.2, whole genome shotgun sequence n=1 Tax=Rhinocladiella mackenziei CBS 650.93 TaxID=1442369 RepID=A0A0D2FZK9_9EURO|nr:uncharacterized protein Z518_02396 [Rhinocladiella mackenziei CBS 650.93]KIX07742.1 hypothetical protein Z518_02396 [Rhinocladiella mackenziei CBS 650.93]
MEQSTTMTSEQSSSLKRPRSPSEIPPFPAAKVPRTATNPLQINYLARQHKETIPLVTVNDKLPEIVRLLNEYDGVIQRHESMAGNLGACPLGPILLKRFERLFEGPPRVLKSHARDSNISWLDVVEFAQSNPKQFNLERTRNGVRVCQFYTKQCRVEISEEDYVLIASGMPQKLIPPQPILEDEEKELGVMDLLDRNLGQVIQLADQVSGRARQLIHKMKNRRTAILSRREQEAELRRNSLRSDGSPISPADTNGVNTGKPVRSIEVSQSPPVGFTAVNLRQTGEQDPRTSGASGEMTRNHTDDLYAPSNTGNVTILNGKSIKDASPSVRAEMMKKFLTPSEREAGLTEETVRRSSLETARSNATQGSSAEKPRSRSIELASGSSGGKNPPTVAIPNTPASLMPHLKPSTFERDDGGPFKSEMVRRMDNMWKGDRVIPPCDRCRRLHMDCLKNLTACMGCTKKHAKCSWKEVKASELQMTAKSTSPEREAAPVSTVPENAPPLSAGSTIEVTRPSNDSMRSSDIASASLELAGDNPEASKEESRHDTDLPRKSEPVQSGTSSARFDVRPPPLVQRSHDAADRRSPTAPNSVASTFSHDQGKDRHHNNDDDDDDNGDRLQALAARVYRTASQSGHRS